MLLFTIKLVHSIILLYMLGCLYVVWQYGLTGLYRRWMPLALASIALEGFVWFAYGMECPLTLWAIAMGDTTGSDLLMDIFFDVSVDIAPSYIASFVVALCVAGWRFWQEQKIPSDPLPKLEAFGKNSDKPRKRGSNSAI